MNCDEVIRELAAPTDDRDSAALAEHLTDCRSCADWARSAEQLDRLWDVTRPHEPSTAVWDAMWARVIAVLDAASSPALSHNAAATRATRAVPTDVISPSNVHSGSAPRRRPWRMAAIGLVGLAQAAAVILAVVLAPRTSNEFPSQSPSAVVSAPVMLNLEIDEGHLVVIRCDQLSAEVEDRTPHESYGFDDWYPVFNTVEGLSKTAIAMKE